MEKSVNPATNDFQKLYDSLTVTEKLSVDSAIKMNFLLFQCMHETFMRQMELKQNERRNEDD